MDGTIVIYEPTQKLSIMGMMPTQRYVSLRDTCIVKYKLKVGDRVLYEGSSSSLVTITAKYIESENHWECDATKIK